MGDEASLKEKLDAAEALVAECDRLINQQVRIINTMRREGFDTADAEHSLEIMIQLQTSQMTFRDRLLRKFESD